MDNQELTVNFGYSLNHLFLFFLSSDLHIMVNQ